MTPQQKLAEKIYEILPDKKVLVSGCEVTQNSYGKTTKHIITDHYRGGVAESYWNTVDGDTVNDEDIISFSGEPIRLADVIRAIEEVGQIENKRIHGIVFGGYTYSYNLSKDNILEQSDKFCEYVYKILTD